MTDWADDIAENLRDETDELMPFVCLRVIAAALRKTRAEALKEAADLVWEKKHWLGYDLAAEISALKDKP